MRNNFYKYIIFWFSQAVSQLGSSMTGFALILWIYMQNGSALEVSLMTFFNYIPFIIISVFSGTFVDRYSKKRIITISDTIASFCSVMILVLFVRQNLQIEHIYFMNFVLGAMNAFQAPASAVVTGQMLSKDRMSQASGLISFSTNLNMVLASVLASALFTIGGLKGILVVDLLSFAVALIVLLHLVNDTKDEAGKEDRQPLGVECRQGLQFLRNNKIVWNVILTMAVLNFFSRLTYENILSPMLLARSGNNSMALGTVNAVMGLAGIIGGIIVASGKMSRKRIKMIYLSAMFSFMFGDLLMGIGSNACVWMVAGIAASLPIPFINAGQNMILYNCVPEYMQGRVFAVRNAIQYSTIPIGILLGGFLADYVFEPFMRSKNAVTAILHACVGDGPGSGMAVMFLVTGIIGSIFSLVAYTRLKKFEF